MDKGTAEHAVTLHVHDLLEHHPGWGATLAQYARQMYEGFYEGPLLDCVVQTPRSSYDLYDAFCYANVHSLVSAGLLAVLRVEVGCEPAADSRLRENNKRLQNIPPPFYGKFSGRKDDSDGVLGWSESVDLPPGRKEEYGHTVLEEPAWVPLEVGYTKAATTWEHIRRCGGIARWPYGHKYITLFLITEELAP